MNEHSFFIVEHASLKNPSPLAMDPHQSVTWWKAMTKDERGLWLTEACSARPADAHQAFLVADAYSTAMSEARAWLDTRER